MSICVEFPITQRDSEPLFRLLPGDVGVHPEAAAVGGDALKRNDMLRRRGKESEGQMDTEDGRC